MAVSTRTAATPTIITRVVNDSNKTTAAMARLPTTSMTSSPPPPSTATITTTTRASRFVFRGLAEKKDMEALNIPTDFGFGLFFSFPEIGSKRIFPPKKINNPKLEVAAANAINVLHDCIYKSVKTGLFLKSFVAACVV